MEMIKQETMKIAPNSRFSFIVSQEFQEGVRVDKYIAQQFPLYSRNFFQQLIDDELITLNGRVVSKPSLVVKPDDKLLVTFPPERKIDKSIVSTTFLEKGLDVKVVGEHEDFLVIYKPTNLLVHSPGPRSKAITLVDWLLVNYPELASVGYSDRPAIIHRLDKDTSGLLIIPRTAYAHAIFGKMFREREIKKVYHAIVHGHPPVSGSIDMAIGRDPRNKKKMAAFITADQNNAAMPVLPPNVSVVDVSENSNCDRNKIRPALTHYRVLEYFENNALVEIQLVTGRMHQIRVHFAAIGHPVFGDPVYGIKSKIIKHQALHATSISFTFEDKEYIFSQDASEAFNRVLKILHSSQ